jgi:LysM domain
MRWRTILFISLGVNVALAAAWIFSVRHYGLGRSAALGSGQTPTVLVKTNVMLRRRFFSWAELESTDYPTYIANLRDIGCPEQTVRDIIIADVNALYAKKRATLIMTSEQQWWRSEPDTNVVRIAAEKLRALDEERRVLLTRLLGPNWESGDLANLPRPTRPGIVLDGPVLGTLSDDAKQAVQQITANAQDRIQAYIDAQRAQGKEPDPVELAKLRQQTRTELAGVLSPEQLEEYLLRYSQEATDLRQQLGQLHYFNATSNEFRAIFRATDAINQQLELIAGNDPNSAAQRGSLEQERENAILVALGPARYEQYLMLHDPIYQQATAEAQAAGTPDAAPALYEIKLAIAQEQAQIDANTNLTAEQKAVQQKQLELEQLRANVLALGQNLPPMPPGLQPPTPAPPPTFSHSVTFGETLTTISQLYGVPVAAIRLANPGFDFSRMKVGDWILIPAASSAPPQ